MSISTKADGLFLTEEELGEIKEIEPTKLGNDEKFPSAVGNICDRFINLREGLNINILQGQLWQPLTIEKQHDENFCLVAKFYLSGGSRVKTPNVLGIDPDYEEVAGNSYLYYLPDTREYEQWQSNSSIQVVMVYANLDYFRAFDDSDRTLPSVLQLLMQDSTRFHQPLGKVSPAMIQVLQQILYCPFQGSAQQIYLESKALELLALQFSSLETDFSTAKQSPLKSSDLERVQYARDILVQCLNKPPSLKELTYQVGLSDRKLKQGFRHLFGTTVFGYLHNYRLEQSQYLLHQPHTTVAQVANQVGYRNPEAFSTAFRRKFDVSPKAYQMGKLK